MVGAGGKREELGPGRRLEESLGDEHAKRVYRRSEGLTANIEVVVPGDFMDVAVSNGLGAPQREFRHLGAMQIVDCRTAHNSHR